MRCWSSAAAPASNSSGSPGELKLLQGLAEGVSIAEAHNRALRADPGLDLSAFLQHHVLGGTLVAFGMATQGEAKR